MASVTRRALPRSKCVDTTRESTAPRKSTFYKQPRQQNRARPLWKLNIHCCGHVVEYFYVLIVSGCVVVQLVFKRPQSRGICPRVPSSLKAGSLVPEYPRSTSEQHAVNILLFRPPDLTSNSDLPWNRSNRAMARKVKRLEVVQGSLAVESATPPRRSREVTPPK